MRLRVLAVCLVSLALVAPAPFAQAQPAGNTSKNDHYDYIALYYGGDFGGQLFASTGLKDIGRGTPHALGLAVGFWGEGMLSGELDFCYHPKFFGANTNLSDPLHFSDNNNLITLTANFVINPTFDFGSQRIRPYVLIGGGLMRGTIQDFGILGKSTKNVGIVDAGGGIQYYFHPRIGVRGDVRYNIGIGAKGTDEMGGTTGWGSIDNWNFWRGTVGIAFTF
jgi:hypothetical protein